MLKFLSVTIVARQTRLAGVYRDLISNLQAASWIIDLLDCTGDLVAKNNRLKDPHWPEATMLEIVKIRTADSTAFNAYPCLPRH